MMTHFEIFIDSFSKVDPRSRELDGDFVICPPVEDYGYRSTPRNALTFAAMGVDGVHFAILEIDGEISDDSPVVQVSPMDSDDVLVLAESFLDYLAEGCQVSLTKMLSVFDAEAAGESQLIPFLSEHFRGHRLLNEDRFQKLTALYGHLMERNDI